MLDSIKLLTVLSCLLVGGCVLKSSTFVEQVQEKAQETCGFLPLARTVSSIVDAASGQPLASSTVAIAAIICGAVSKPEGVQTFASTPPVVTVNGQEIRVEGDFVEKE